MELMCRGLKGHTGAESTINTQKITDDISINLWTFATKSSTISLWVEAINMKAERFRLFVVEDIA